MKITIVDYGAGNLASVERAIQELGAETEFATCPEQIAGARAIVLPGVGHFSAFVSGLERANLSGALRAAFENRVPILGICLGLQALFAASEEAPGEAGLGFLDGTVQALPATVKTPHIGWNQVTQSRPGVLLRGIPDNSYFYFAHSFAARAAVRETAAICEHGIPFAAAIERDHLLAVQFHPEKSGDCGAQLLRNFLEFAS